MLFNSVSYIFVFLPVTVAVFWVLMWQGQKRVALSALSLASLVFYGWWNPLYLPLLIGLMIVNFLIGAYLMRATQWRKAVLVAGLALNLCTLAYFKYAAFLAANANEVFGTHIAVGTIVLPLAISFFTFQKIAYICDAYAGKVSDRSFLHFSLFVSFFPQLIAGPIVHHRDVIPQFSALRTSDINWGVAATGLGLFTVGLFKKVVIADGLAQFVGPLFDAATTGARLTAADAWLAMLSYTFQLYFDFSGYSDMAIASALFFGIRLPINFFSPYKATNIIEFWRCWHMTLSRFLRDYLYIPLGGNRSGALRRYINLFLTMVLGGLWHGAGWTFVAWGALHGAYLTVNHLFRLAFGEMKSRLWNAAGFVLTFLAVAVGWVLFRAPTLGSASNILSGLAGPLDAPLHLPPAVTGTVAIVTSRPDEAAIILLLAAAGIAFGLPNTAQCFLERTSRLSFQANIVFFILLLVLWLGIALSLGGPSEFLYFQF